MLVLGTLIISVSAESGKSIPGGLQLSSNGTRNQQVSFKLDGTTNTDTYFQENQTFPFPDALQEFSIQTSNCSAAQGNNAGAVVDVVTRSGTNSLHGGAFEFVRNRVFNARKFFSPTQDFLERNQFGAYGGGPVRFPGYNGRRSEFYNIFNQHAFLAVADVNTVTPITSAQFGQYTSEPECANHPSGRADRLSIWGDLSSITRFRLRRSFVELAVAERCSASRSSAPRHKSPRSCLLRPILREDHSRRTASPGTRYQAVSPSCKRRELGSD